VQKVRRETDAELQAKVVELLERVLLVRFPEFGVEAMRMKFKLHDIKESKVWKEAVQEGKEEGKEVGKTDERETIVRKCLAKGMTERQISELLDIRIQEVRRLTNGHPQ
jgi:predicted transposase YdaD